MKVILTENVKKVGKKGEIVELNDSYARNCIINKKLGLEASAVNLNNLKLQKNGEEKQAKQRLEDAKALAATLEKSTVTVSIKKGQDGRTFGSISTKEIVTAVKEQLGYELDKKKVVLNNPIKNIGDFTIEVKLHPEVTGEFKLKVVEK